MSVMMDDGSRHPVGAAPAPVNAAADNLRGASFMALSMTVYTCNDATMKFVSEGVPLYQAITLRSLAACLILMVVIACGPFRRDLRLLAGIGRRDAGLIGLRMICEAGSTVLYLGALTYMALGDVSAIAQSTPLFVVLAAALFLRERIGWRRLLAVAVGVVGMLIILRPGTPRFGGGALMVLAAVLLVVARDILTRKLGRGLPPLLVALSAAVAVTGFSAFMSIFQGWQTPTAREFGLLGLAAVLVSLGYFTAILTMRVGDVSFSAPFRYVSLVVAVALGYVVFGEFPDLWTWIGAGLIIGAGLFVAWREAALARAHSRAGRKAHRGPPGQAD